MLQIEEPLFDAFDRILEPQATFFGQVACERMCCVDTHYGCGARERRLLIDPGGHPCRKPIHGPPGNPGEAQNLDKQKRDYD